MMFLPAKVVEGLLVIACSSLYTHIFVEGAVTGFNLTNTTVQLIYLILAGWMANSARNIARTAGAACFRPFRPFISVCACSSRQAAASRQL